MIIIIDGYSFVKHQRVFIYSAKFSFTKFRNSLSLLFHVKSSKLQKEESFDCTKQFPLSKNGLGLFLVQLFLCLEESNISSSQSGKGSKLLQEHSTKQDSISSNGPGKESKLFPISLHPLSETLGQDLKSLVFGSKISSSGISYSQLF